MNTVIELLTIDGDWQPLSDWVVGTVIDVTMHDSDNPGWVTATLDDGESFELLAEGVRFRVVRDV